MKKKSMIGLARWITDKYIYVMLGVFPLFWGGGYPNITEPKALFFYGATALWLLCVLILGALSALRREGFRPALRPVHWALAAFLLLAAVSALLSPWWQNSLLGAPSTNGKPRYDGFATLVCYGALFFGVSLLARPKRSYVWVMAGAAALCCLVAALQLLGFDPFGLYPSGTNYYDKFGAYSGAFLGTIGNIGLLGQYLCIVTPVTAVSGLRAKRRWERIYLLSAAALCLVILAFSQAEAAYVGTLACVLVCVPVLLPTRKARRAAGLCSVLAVLAGLAVLWFWPGQSGTLWEASRVLHGDIRDEFGSRRIEIWRGALALVPDRPLLGGGPGTFGERIDISWSRFIEETGQMRTAVVSNAHNLYLAYLVNNGALGLAAYLACIACSAVTWVRGRFNGDYIGAAGCGLLCCMVQDFFCVALSLAAPVMWVVWALMESGDARPEEETEEAAPPEEEPEAAPPEKTEGAAPPPEKEAAGAE